LTELFKSRGLYIALLILSTLILLAVLGFAFSLPAGFNPEMQMPKSQNQMPQPPEGFGGMPSVPDFEGMPQMGERPDMPQVQSGTGSGRYLPLIAAICVVLDIISLTALIMISRRSRRLAAEADSVDADDEDEPPHRKKKGSGGMILIGLAAAAVLAVSLTPDTSVDESAAEVERQLIEVTAEHGSISRTLITGGSVAETTEKPVTLAGDIKVESWLVNSGDYVEQGQSIARVDRDSVILSIASLIEIMDELDGDIEASRNDVIENAIYAPAAGRIKSVYAQPGMDVQDVVSEYSCLMRLSIDGLMAADMSAVEGMYSGMPVTVMLSDGSTEQGKVEHVFDGKATVTISDERAAYGDSAEIYDEIGKLLGESTLYIHKEVKITGIGGTVQRLNVEENMRVGTDMALVVLTNTAYSGQRDILTARRRELENELTKLFSAYNSGEIFAPCTGRIAAINEDIVVEELSNADDPAGPENEPASMESYAVIVTGIENDLHTVTYTEGSIAIEKELDLSDTLIFRFVNGGYQPAEAAQIKVGDSLVLGCYVNGGVSELDHVVIYSARSDSGEKPGDTGSNLTGGAGTSSGGSSGGMGGFSMSGSGNSYKASVNEEDPYATEKTILSYITPFDTAQINISVDELDIASYHVGQSVEISFDALPGRLFAGEVSRIDPNGENEDGGSTKYKVLVETERTEDMLTGMNASVRMTVDSRDNVLLLPLAAISEENGKISVYSSYDEENDLLGTPVEVTTGWSDGEMVEIVSGLEAGDSCFYRYADTIRYAFQQ